MDQRASFLADQSEAFSLSSMAKTKSPQLWRFAISLQYDIFSCTYTNENETLPSPIALTPAGLPENLFVSATTSQGWRFLLEKHCWNFFPFLVCHSCLVDHLHLDLIHQLNGRYWNTSSHDLGCRCRSIPNSGKGDDGNTSLLGYDREFKSNFRYKTKSAFRADKKSCQIISSR
jgi:hypothetical protein